MNIHPQHTNPLHNLAECWVLEPSVIFLNHGSFGACPRAVLQAQQAVRDRMEGDPVHFFKRELESLLDEALAELARYLGCDREGLAFVPNTTTGVNTVLRSLPVRQGDELLTTTHAYNACKNALEFVARRAGARVVQAPVPFPLQSDEEIVTAILAAVTPRTRVALLDHVSSPTGLIFPITRLVRELRGRGIETLVDGAHAPGMVPLQLDQIGASYYVGNCHKWLCAPKGSAFLYVSSPRRSEVHPLAISHGASSPRTDRSRFRLEFDWMGTDDVSAYLAVPVAIRFLDSLLPGGWATVRERNHSLIVQARALLCRELGLGIPCPDQILGALAALALPDAEGDDSRAGWGFDPLQEALYRRFRIEVPITPWPAPPKRLLRISAHLYNSEGQYASLARALKELLPS